MSREPKSGTDAAASGSPMGMTREPGLVYVEGSWAYFGGDDSYGDDWDDAPYEHNAGPPYTFRLKVAYDGPLETPSAGRLNSGWSVDAINARQVPWLADFLGGGRWNPVQVWAGTTFHDFVRLIEESGGHVWVPMDGVPSFAAAGPEPEGSRGPQVRGGG